MPRAYSADLRERALAAHEAGEGSQTELAQRFRIAARTLLALAASGPHGGPP
jgi:transposase